MNRTEEVHGNRRRLPRWSEIEPLIGLEMPTLRRRSRAAQAESVRQLRRIAFERAPRAVFDYVDGAAESEISLRRARHAFRNAEFRPSVLRNVADVDLSCSIQNSSASMPVVLAPTGFTRMMHAEGERAVAVAAEGHSVPYALSTMGTTTPEDVAAAAPDLHRWFQLYIWKDRDATQELIARAEAAGYEALVLTVDTPVAGARMRDVRNGLTIPPKLTLRTLIDMFIHPAWWMDLLTTEPLEFATLSSFDGTVAELANAMFDPSVTFEDLEWLRNRWQGPLVVKGIQTVNDAKECVAKGVDGIVVSNHGGRQLDRAPTPLLQLPKIVDAVGGQAEVYLDGGILSGGDVIAAVASGATACLVGRAYLYGLMAGGFDGVDRTLEIFANEMTRTLQLLGVRAVSELTPDHVRLPEG